MNNNKFIDAVDKFIMYNSLYIQAYDFLKQHFQEPFVYKVWEEKGAIIGVNDGKNIYKYNYKYCNNKLERVGEEKYEQENR